jgi:hypothetical protein
MVYVASLSFKIVRLYIRLNCHCKYQIQILFRYHTLLILFLIILQNVTRNKVSSRGIADKTSLAKFQKALSKYQISGLLNPISGIKL